MAQHERTGPLDVITIGRASVDLYGQQIGSRLEDIDEFRQVGRRLPGQHFRRHRAARPALGAAHPRRRRADGPLHPRAAGARRRVGRGHHHRQGAADRAGAAVGRGRRRLADDLRAHRLRRHGAVGGGRRRGFHRVGARHRRHRHAFLASRTARPRSSRRSASPRRTAARSCSTSTTARTSGASPAMPRASSAM